MLFSRTGCHLCDVMKSVIERVAARTPVQLEVIDIEGHPDLERLYGEQIPVLLIDGRKVAKYRLTQEELLRKLRARDVASPEP
jgi:hypothetical protein